jgi:HSP20 family protein
MFWRDTGRRSLWREMDRLQGEMNRVMGSFAPRGTGSFPPLNMWANEEHVVLTAELPGVDPDSLDISVVGDTVTLSGSRDLDASGDEARYHRHERWHGTFNRTLQLPFRIDAGKVDAQFAKGVLKVMLPRAEEDRPRRISIGSEQHERLTEGEPA